MPVLTVTPPLKCVFTTQHRGYNLQELVDGVTNTTVVALVVKVVLLGKEKTTSLVLVLL
jgi:hypothetical protein